MSYRTINVNGTDYEYVIGKSNIHIKGFGDFPVSVHGNAIAYPGHDGKPNVQKSYVATPATVRALILGQETPIVLDKKTKTRYYMSNPFSAEIYQKVEYIPFDADLYHRLADNI